MRLDTSKHAHSGAKLYEFLESGRLHDFSKWLRKHQSNSTIDGINEGCGSLKTSLLLKAVSISEVRWEEIVLLIDKFKADPLKKDLNRWTILHWAAFGNNANVTKRLLNRYDHVRHLINNVSTTCVPGNSAMMLAAEHRHYETFHVLLDAEADPLLINTHGKTVLDVLEEQHRTVDIQRVIKACIDKDRCCLIEAAEQGHWNLIKRVINEVKDGTIIEQRKKSGETLLHVATCEGKDDLVEMLLKRNCDPNVPDDKGYTPIFGSVDNTSTAACATVLLNYNADVTLLDKSACTLFHHIAYEGRTDILNVILQNVSEEILLSIIDLPCGTRTLHSPVLSRRVTLKGSPLQIAALMGKHECIPIFVKMGADMFGEDHKGRNIIDIIKDEKSFDGSKNIPDLDKVLSLLYKFDSTWQQAKRLMEVHYDPDFRCDNGETVLHLACKASDSTRTARLFLDHLADPSVLDESNNSPLHYAIHSCGQKKEEIIELLLEYDAPVVYKDKQGAVHNMLTEALLAGNVHVAHILFATKSHILLPDLSCRPFTSKQLLLLILNEHTAAIRFAVDNQLPNWQELLRGESAMSIKEINKVFKGGAFTNLNDTEVLSITPVQLAAFCFQFDTLKIFKELDMSLHEPNSKGETAVTLLKKHCNTSDSRVFHMLAYLSGLRSSSISGSSFYLSSIGGDTSTKGTKVSIHTTQSMQEINNGDGYKRQSFTSTNHRSLIRSQHRLAGKANPTRLSFSSSFEDHSASQKRNNFQRQRASFSSTCKHTEMTWAEVRNSLKAGNDPNKKLVDGKTLLHLFCEEGKSSKTVELLLQCNADPNVTDDKNETPLCSAVRSEGPKQTEIVDLLFEYGSKPWIRTPDQDCSMSALMLALQYQSYDIAILIYKQSPQRTRENLHNNPVSVSIIAELVASGNIQLMKFLKNQLHLPYVKSYLESNIDYRLPSSLTEDIPLATLLENPEDDVEVYHETSTSFVQDLLCPGNSLHIASLHCDVAMLTFLLNECAVSRSARDARGRTPLQLLQACQLFLKEEYRLRLPEVLSLLGADASATMLPSVMCVDEDHDELSSMGSAHHAHSTRRISSLTLTHIQSRIRQVVNTSFREISQGVTHKENPEVIAKINEIENRTKSDIENYLLLLDGIVQPRLPARGFDEVSTPSKASYEHQLSIALSDTSHSLNEHIDSSVLDLVQEDLTPKFDVASDKGTEKDLDMDFPPSIAQGEELRYASQENMTSYELFGHIAQRMEQKGCGWESLLDKLTLDQGVKRKIYDSMLENRNTPDTPSLHGTVYETLILWKHYSATTEVEQTSRLRRALDDLAMNDLADELTFAFKGQGYML